MAETTMLKFVDRLQAYPPKRAAEARAQDFQEGVAHSAVCLIARFIALSTTTFPIGCA
jgi:hypothetical protein